MPAPPHGFAFESVGRQQRHGFARLGRGPLDRGPAACKIPDMLGPPLIGLEAGKSEVGGTVDRLREDQRRRARRHAAAVGADIDLNQNIEADARSLGRLGKLGDIAQVIDTDADPGIPRQSGEAGELAMADDLIADQDVVDATFNQRFRLANLLTAGTNGAECDLPARDGRAFVGLRMRPQAHSCGANHGGHAFEVFLERVQFNDERWSLDLLEWHPGFGGRRINHGLGTPSCLSFGRCLNLPAMATVAELSREH